MSIEELKEIIFQNRCVFLNTKQHCLSDDMSAYDCEECSDKIVDEFVEKIRVDERTKAERDFQNTDYWNDYLSKLLADERAKAFKEFVDLYREFCNAPSDESCLIEDECEGMCIDCFEKWLQKKEQK